MTEQFELPSIYDFPPFFTRQPNENTWAAQRGIWISLILSYFKHLRLYKLDCTSATSIDQVDLFRNKSINRQLKPEVLQEIVGVMIREGTAEAVTWNSVAGKMIPAEVLIYWRTPSEWANYIAEWVRHFMSKEDLECSCFRLNLLGK